MTVSSSFLQGTTAAVRNDSASPGIAVSTSVHTATGAGIPVLDTPAPPQPSPLLNPAAAGMKAWNYPAIFASATSSALALGKMLLLRVPLINGGSRSVTNIVLGCAGTATGATSGQNFAGLYDSAGTLLGQTADQSVNWTTGVLGLITAPLAGGPVTVTGDHCWVAVLPNASSAGPTFARASGSGVGILIANLTTVPSALWFATQGTGLTALPSAFDPASNATNSAFSVWTGLS